MCTSAPPIMPSAETLAHRVRSLSALGDWEQLKDRPLSLLFSAMTDA